MKMANEWYLRRLGRFTQVYKLKIGCNQIGRHKQAHIITISDICSRTHCVINLIDNHITIEDRVRILISI